MKKWCVYLLLCNDGTYYCGATNDLPKRVKKHNDGKGAKYTRSRLPIEVLCSREVLTKSEALKLEIRVKRLPRSSKIAFLSDG